MQYRQILYTLTSTEVPSNTNMIIVLHYCSTNTTVAARVSCIHRAHSERPMTKVPSGYPTAWTLQVAIKIGKRPKSPKRPKRPIKSSVQTARGYFAGPLELSEQPAPEKITITDHYGIQSVYNVYISLTS